MTIDDEQRASQYLKYIGYYRIAGYARHFRRPGADDPERFEAGTAFEAALALYVFDRKLRVLLFDAIERVEVAIKATMTNVVGANGDPFWLTNANNFDYGQHQRIIDEIASAIGDHPSNSHHQFISHFYRTYSNTYPPSWMLMECFTFGAVSRIYKLLRGVHRQGISQEFRLQHDMLESWLHAISFARNLCAHHSLLWRRSFTIRPAIPKPYKSTWPANSSTKLYVQCCVLHHMMGIIADGSRWADRLRDTIEANPHAELKDMGFPEGWDKQPFWGFQ